MSETTTDFLHSDSSPNEGDAQAIIDIATAAAVPQPLPGDDRFVTVTVPAGGSTWLIDQLAQGEAYDDHPLRAKGKSEAHDAISLAAVIVKYGDVNTEVWASERDRTIVAVINAGYAIDDEDDVTAGWGDHRATYQARRTPEWEAWVKADGNLTDQVAFAELIEDQLSFIVQPDSLDMLELAQTFHATQGVTFKSSQRLQSGERKFVYEESTAATAGPVGDMEVPETFVIRLAPYEGAETVDITCRLRFRMGGGSLRLGYKIVEREQIERDAFRSVVASVNDHLQNGEDVTRQFLPVLMGVPAAAQTPAMTRR